MVTVVNNPAAGNGDAGGNGMGFFMGILLLVVVVFLVVMYGLPSIRQGTGSGTGSTATQPNIKVPDKIDVNIQPKTTQ
jgi:uncharacterized membrane protein